MTLDNKLLRDIGAVSRIIQFTSDSAFKSLKLQKGQFMFLTRVCENPGINLGQLANLVHVDKTTATKAVQKLITRNYLRRKDDPADGRSVLLYPTELGSVTYERILAQENRYLDICLKNLSPHEIAQLNSLLGRVSANLEDVWQSLK